MSVKNWTLAKAGEACSDCDRECETVPASYILTDGTPVCDSHLEIRTEADEQAEFEAAEGRKVAREVAAEEAAAMEDHILDAYRDGLHAERRDLVNLYVGDDRSEKIAGVDLRIAAAEEEQAKRAGLMSSEDILAAFSGAEDLSLEIEAANALPRPANGSYEIGQRIICVNLPHLGATVRSLDDTGVGLDYDTDDDEERGTYEALYSAIRPMPIH